MGASPGRAVIVIGMHRTGTSAVTRGLRDLGVDLGGNLLVESVPDNPMGYWEDRDFLSVNMRLLEALGIRWDAVSLIASERWQSPEVRALQLEALGIIRDRFGDSPLWGFKDPRTIRVLPFWRGLFADLKVQSTYVVVVRNPLSVAHSLYERNGIAFEKGHLLWLVYYVPYLRLIHDCPFVVIDYDEMMADPASQLARIATELGFSGSNPGSDPVDHHARNFLKDELRHHGFTEEDLNITETAGPLTTKAYKWLRRLARGKSDRSVSEFWDGWQEIAKDLTAVAPICRYLDRAGGEIAALEEEVAALKEEVGRRQEEITVLREDLARTGEEIAALHASTSWRLTWPIRAVKGLWLARSSWADWLSPRILLRALLPNNYGAPYHLVRKAYRTLPLPSGLKRRVADNLLWRFPALRDRIFGAVYGEGIYLRGPDLRRVLIGPDPSTRILIVDHRIPTPDRTGSSVRMLAIMKILRTMGFRVTMISDAEKNEYRWILENLNEIGRYEEELGKLEVPFYYGYRAALAHLYSEGHTYRYVLLSFPEVAHRYLPAVRFYAVHARLLYDTVDLHGLRMAREAELAKDEALRKKAAYFQTIETLNCRCSDLTIAISSDEKNYVLKQCPDVAVEVIPNIHEISANSSPVSERYGLIFIGHYLHTPNEDAMVHFVNTILPLIARRLPKLTLTILGSSITARVKTLASPRVQVVGYVPDPSPYFQRARVFVAPIRYGAGMKGKIGYSMSLGVPVVSTAMGAEGIGLTDKENVLIADDPWHFAEAVVELHGNEVLWQKLSANGLRYIHENFSESAVGNALRRVFTPSPTDAWEQ